MLDIALIGAGRMGTNHATAIGRNPHCRVAWVVDYNTAAARALAGGIGAKWATSIDEVTAVDAAVIATPTSCHLRHATKLRDVPTLVEKPLAGTIDDARRIVDQHRATLTVGHVERHNPRLTEATFTDVVHIDARRHGTVGRTPDDVVFDLMIHDIDLAASIAASQPVVVAGVGRHDLATAVIKFDNGVTASLQAGRLNDVRERTLTVTSTTGVQHIDLLDGHGLDAQLADFVTAIEHGTAPTVTGQHGIDAVTTAWQIVRQL